MPEEVKNEQLDATDDVQHGNENKPEEKGLGMLTWLILGGIVLVGVGGGYGLAMLSAGTVPVENEQLEEEIVAQTEETETLDAESGSAVEEAGTWEVQLDPVIANLDEPGVTRYIRATLILQFSDELDEGSNREIIEAKKSELIDWLYTYMAGLSLDEVQGTRCIERFKMKILRNFNDLLFPGDKPMLKRILTKEFQVQ